MGKHPAGGTRGTVSGTRGTTTGGTGGGTHGGNWWTGGGTHGGNWWTGGGGGSGGHHGGGTHGGNWWTGGSGGSGGHHHGGTHGGGTHGGDGTVDGTNGSDTMLPGYVDAQGDTIDGADGNNDIIYGYGGNDVIEAGQGNDLVYGGEGNDIIDGGAGSDTLFGGAGNDTFVLGPNGGGGGTGGGGTGSHHGGSGGTGSSCGTGGTGGSGYHTGGADTLYGGVGSDTFIGGAAGDIIYGGEGSPDNDPEQDQDVLDLTGRNVDHIAYTPGTDNEDGVVHFQDGSTMEFHEIENVIPCFTPGTLIATPKGERRVEELTVGDRVITRDNGFQEIAWVGRKELSQSALLQATHLRPILIRSGALGNGQPERDMLVSPSHRVLVASDRAQLYFEEGEVLVAAKHLAGRPGIMAVEMASTTYIHFMCERHEVVLSDGAWTESFQPGDYSLKGIAGQSRAEIYELFPDLRSKDGIENYQSARKSLKKHEAKLLLR